MAEEVLVHEAVVALRVVPRDPNVLVHVESDHIAEGDLASFVALNKMLINPDGAASSGKAQDKRVLCRGIEGFDAFYV
jgi:hypothetical protein